MGIEKKLNFKQKVIGAGVGLGMLIQSVLPGYVSNSYAADSEAAINQNNQPAYSQQEEGVRLPDLSKAKYLGEKGPFDMFAEIEGNETIVKGYLLDESTMVSLYSLPNGKVFGFAYNYKNGAKECYNDIDGDGIFENPSCKSQINRSAYDY